MYAIRRDGSLEAVVTDRGSCDSFDIMDGHMVVCGLYGDNLAELYLDGKQITHFNDMSQWTRVQERSTALRQRTGFP